MTFCQGELLTLMSASSINGYKLAEVPAADVLKQAALERNRTIQHSIKSIASSSQHIAVQKSNGEVVFYEHQAGKPAHLEISQGILALKAGGKCIAIQTDEN